MVSVNKFTCDELSQYTDSLLFDSGTVVAELDMTDTYGNRAVMSLEVRGEVRVKLKGSDECWCTRPSEFPEAVREAIENGQFGLLDESDASYNWFELMFTIFNNKGEMIVQDGDVYEGELDMLTPEDLKALMIEDGKVFIKHYTESKVKAS